jgi:hypothetical protein
MPPAVTAYSVSRTAFMALPAQGRAFLPFRIFHGDFLRIKNFFSINLQILVKNP